MTAHTKRTNRQARVLGLVASPRTARDREGARLLMEDLKDLPDKAALLEYLQRQGNLHLERLEQAGRNKGLSHDQIFANLHKMRSREGLCNSETCLAAALWGALNEGAEVEIIPLRQHFSPFGEGRDLEDLLAQVERADGLIISTPVYFGDRSSLCQRFIETLRQRKVLLGGRPKVYGGLSVGAKRNGGQETSLIYQMQDMMQIGALGVGNDYRTTSQYGGTGHAGDIGTMAADPYGISTSVGTGRRVAHVAHCLRNGRQFHLKDKLRASIWLLQDKDGTLERLLQPMLGVLSEKADFDLLRLHEKKIRSCMACDICPARIGPDDEYRCACAKDDMREIHSRLLHSDLVIPAVYSPRDRNGLRTVYQRFLERTRYLRRGDYVLTDTLFAPLVLADIGASENLGMRMLTSFIRHHTIMHRPAQGWLQDGRLINEEEVLQTLESAIGLGKEATVGRLAHIQEGHLGTVYKPKGYVLSSAKDRTSDAIASRQKTIDGRSSRLDEESRSRLEPASGPEASS